MDNVLGLCLAFSLIAGGVYLTFIGILGFINLWSKK